MKSDIRFMLKLIASVVLNKEAPEVAADVNWENILKIASIHNVANIVAYGIAKGGYNVPLQIKAQFDLKLYERMTVSDNQNAEIDKIFKAFEENEIQYMPFKGIILQKLYPFDDMRFMADADVLIKKENFQKINEIMLDLGYIFKEEGPIEYNYIKKPYIHLELHKNIISPSSKDLYDYYKDCWSFARKTDSLYRYELGLEDHFIFNFNHFVRHYRDAGVGIKGVIDLWLYTKKHPDMNMEYIYSELDKTNMRTFFDNLMKLSGVWFEGKEADDVTMAMSEFIINSGTFGTFKNKVSAEAIREVKNIKKAEKFKVIRFIFPGFEKMKGIFPILHKFPILLPLLWMWRVIRFILFRRENLNTHREYIESIDNESIILYDKHMKNVGLDIYNGRKN